MITIYGMGSPNVMKVFIALEEMGLTYETQPVDLLAGEQFREAFQALNPVGKVPVIVDSDGPEGQPITIFESGAILLYLAEKTGAFFPRETRARLEATQWLMVQLTAIGPMFGQYFHFRNYAEGDNAYAKARYTTHSVKLCEILDRRLSVSPFVGGQDYGLADMATFPWLRNIATYFEEAEARYPHVLAWARTLGQRPPVQRGIAATQAAQQALTSFDQADADGRDRFFGRGRFTAN